MRVEISINSDSAVREEGWYYQFVILTNANGQCFIII